MNEHMLTIAAASTIPLPVIIGAILALAAVVCGSAIFIMRSGKKKAAEAVNSDWQPQGQGQAEAGWNQQQNSWGAPQQQQMQQANPWGAPQQPQSNPWGSPSSAQNAPAQQASNPWGAPQQQQQQQQPQQPANPWGAPQQPQQQPANPWGAPQMNQTQPGGGQWSGQGAQNPWEAAPAAAPVAQDAWGAQQQPGSGQQWGTQPGSSPMQPQQGPNSFAGTSGQGWGQQPQQPQQQQQQADPWGTPQQQAFGGAQNAQSPWQQAGQPGQPGNVNQGGFGAPALEPTAYSMDNDRTVLRSGNVPQQPFGGNPAAASSVGYVRVEEGKEPGRIYEIRKESLSIGRSRESDIFLEDLAVSRLHASLVNMGNGAYALKDEGSANGTKVNGQLVNKFQTYPLQEGDRIQLGQTVLVFGRK